MISTEHDFIFVHPPKTGGNTMHKILQPYYDPSIIIQFKHNGMGPGQGVATYVENPDSDLSRGPWDKRTVNAPKKLPINKHLTYQQLLSSPLIVATKDMKFVSAIRNPWDRVVSYYCWASSPDSLSDWYSTNSFNVSNLPCSSYWSGHYPDFVIRHECFESDVTQLLYYLSIPMPNSLAENTINVSKAREREERDPLSYREFYINKDGSYNEELIEKIRKDAQADIEFSEKIFIKPYDF